MSMVLPTALLALGIVILVASLDDLLIDILSAFKVRKPRTKQLSDDFVIGTDATDPSIAIFVANWHEEDVLGPMVERNLANFKYKKVKFVLGVYPNDTATANVAHELAKKYQTFVEVVVNRRVGPTSKGQMLNEMFYQVFSNPDEAPDLVVLHDSEDVIAPRSFEVYALECQQHAMIQIPIFSIDSRHRSLVGATYMEEFAERHTREMALREKLGAFVPSAGVGTCLRKDLILHFLNTRGHVLQSGSVTEDYILGAEAHQAGYSTTFAAYRCNASPTAELIATREFFPKDFWASVRQRTRWTYGIGFEGTRQLGWFGNTTNRFFLYRDRKGTIANFLPLVSLALLFLALLYSPNFQDWEPWQRTGLYLVLGMNSINILIRVYFKCSALHEVYGNFDLIGVVLRWPVAIVVNAFAAARAWRSFIVDSGLAAKPIAWAKTQHELPANFALVAARSPVTRSNATRTDFTPSYRRRALGGVAFACLMLLVLGGLRINDILLAPAVVQVKTETSQSIALQIDETERQIVADSNLTSILKAVGLDQDANKSRPASRKFEYVRSNTVSLAEQSITTSAINENKILNEATEPAPLRFVSQETNHIGLDEADENTDVSKATDMAEPSNVDVETPKYESASELAAKSLEIEIAQEQMTLASMNTATLFTDSTPHTVIESDSKAEIPISNVETNRLIAELTAERPDLNRNIVAELEALRQSDDALLNASLKENDLVANYDPKNNPVSNEILGSPELPTIGTEVQESALLEKDPAPIKKMASRKPNHKFSTGKPSKIYAVAHKGKLKISKTKSKLNKPNVKVASKKLRANAPTPLRATTFLRRGCRGHTCAKNRNFNQISSFTQNSSSL
jgi:adsorption protein B